MAIYQSEGLGDTAYTALKAAAKAELPFPVTIRRHTKHYVWHHVDIRPTAKTQHRFSEAQVAALRDFCDRHGLDDNLHAVSNRAGYHACVFWQGLNYLAKHTVIA